MKHRLITPGRARTVTWLLMGAIYLLIGSLAPFVFLLGWWEALPAVGITLILSDRAAALAERVNPPVRTIHVDEAAPRVTAEHPALSIPRDDGS
ncbi:MAG TPA: hypothetical protein VFJ66_03930 [Gaiellales bacterium]|nr:hypothetical protein [Gaiellales bacterium]